MIWFLILGLIIFLAPTNWFLQLGDQNAYLVGLKVDYLIPKLYPVDILVAFSVGLWMKSQILSLSRDKTLKFAKKNWRKFLLFVPLLAIFFLVQVLSELPVLAMIWAIRLAFFVTFSLVIQNIIQKYKTKAGWQHKSDLPYWALILTVITQSLIGIGQFWQQHSLAGYWFLGETNLSYFANISKVSLGGAELVAAYGTTAHPNILAGLMAVFLVLIFARWRLIGKVGQQARNLSSGALKIAVPVTLILGAITLLLTFSLSGWLILLTSSLVILFKDTRMTKIYQKSSFGILLASAAAMALLGKEISPTEIRQSPAGWPNSLARRLYLAEAAIKMWLADLWTGVGLGHFTANLEKFSKTTEVVRFLQPVHHSFLLLLSETGIMGATFVYKMRKTLAFSIAALLPGLIWDHYWLTQPNALLILLLLTVLREIFSTEFQEQ